MVSRLLRDANYKIITASNAKDSLELYEKHREEIGLVLLDLIMPEIGGKHCLYALRNMDPNVKVLILTGYTQRGMTQELKDAGAKGFIHISHLTRRNSLRRSGRLLMGSENKANGVSS